jgi:hypothetical protein
VALFQKTVLKEFVKAQNQVLIQEAFDKFQAHFGNPAVQQNILQAKEEQYQEGFLKDLFVNVLGYSLYPQPNHNLITEQKNETDSKKADAAILLEGKIVGVIEMKAVREVQNLDRIELQAFSYKNAHQNCRYVITSNFQKLRFYLDNTIECEEFDLFSLDLENFQVLYTILHQRNIVKHLPIVLKEKSIQREQEITLAFYNDYEAFRESLFKNIAQLNRQYDKLLLFEKTQKILDRIVFMCFAQDKGLLPANLIHTIIKEWEDFKAAGLKITLYDRFKAHFEFINTGFQSTKYDIYPYNGGLFAKDEVLDNLLIDDKNLRSRSEGLSSYDFNSDIDTNVLGHIFEHSLNQLEAKRAELIEEAENEALGRKTKKKTKRKIDGIFYTPLYITHYVIEETLGKLCEEKRKELDWENLTVEKIQTYRNWLLTIRVLDPACGSGAFLNQVLTFFIKEHQKTDEWESILTQKRIVSDLHHQILENNIFGVDINFESVSITKLSLWLRIAQDKRKLNDLSENIKQGNSLIDDKSIDERAFDWKANFVKNGENGFDLIVGNPPWGAFLERKEWLKKTYPNSSFGEINSYKYFIDKGLDLLRNGGILSFILPDSYLEKEYFTDVRKLIVKNSFLIQNLRLGDNIFKEVNLPSAILTVRKGDNQEKTFLFADISKYDLKDRIVLLESKREDIIFQVQQPDIEQSFTVKSCFFRKDKYLKLIDLYDQVMGVKVYQVGKGKPKQTSYELENNIFISDKKLNANYLPFISQGIYRYFYENKNEFINYGEWLAEPRELRYFTQPKIVVREVMNTYVYATLIKNEAVVKNIAGVIVQKDKNYSLEYLLALLCSKLFAYCIKQESPKSANQAFPSINSNLLKNLPIKELSLENQQPYIEKVNRLLSLNQQFYQSQKDFLELMASNFEKEKFTRRLEKWHELEWHEFSKELEKSKIKLSLPKQKEWKNFFKEEKSKIMPLDSEIQQLEKEIDTLVYQLYGLTEQEIKMVENG